MVPLSISIVAQKRTTTTIADVTNTPIRFTGTLRSYRTNEHKGNVCLGERRYDRSIGGGNGPRFVSMSRDGKSVDLVSSGA